MWYHAIGHYGKGGRFWLNRSRDDLIKDVLVPFVSKQSAVLTRRGVPAIFNFGSIDYVTIVKTRVRLAGTRTKSPPELKDAKFVADHCATKEFLKDMHILSSSPRVKSLLEQAAIPPKKQIFVVMKFGDEDLDSAYTGVIKPVGESYGFNVLRVDEIQNSGSINQQMLEEISSSEIVLADLTGERPNCYYEAGFAHAIGKEMIFSIREGSTIHFDLANNRFISWRTEADFRKKLKARLDSITSKTAV